MRISDWSSDVCSSDLWAVPPVYALHRKGRLSASSTSMPMDCQIPFNALVKWRAAARHSPPILAPRPLAPRLCRPPSTLSEGSTCCATLRAYRSEEHTSELQSLMRNSYAVFCLKKKTTTL